MGQPKAKWSPYDEDTKRIWTAVVGPFYLDVNANDGTCEIAEWEADSGTIGETLWEQDMPTHCDIVDLMLLAEAELERRLRGAADTMDGKELVAEQLERGTDILSVQVADDVIPEHYDDAKASLEFREWIAKRIRTKFAPETPFHAGECLIHGRKSTECGCATLPAFSAKHTTGANCSVREACGTHCLPPAA